MNSKSGINKSLFKETKKQSDFEKLWDAFEQKGTNKISVNLAAGINYRACEIEVSATYLPFKYIGGTLGLNTYFQPANTAPTYTGSALNNEVWMISGKENYPSRLLFRPAIRFRSPPIKVYDEWGLTFNIEPGLYFSPPANKGIQVEYRNKDKPYSLYPNRTIFF